MKKYLLMILLLSSLVYADGMMMIYDQDAWSYSPEQKQYAAINFHDSQQEMILSIEANLFGNHAVWVFPVPASPKDTKIDLIKGFPRFTGKNVKRAANDKIESLFDNALMTQIYPLIAGFRVGSFGRQILGEGLGVDVYQIVTRQGITSELVSAKDGEAMYTYLEGKGLAFPTKDVIDYYVGKDYSFVVSYISNVTQYKNQSNERYSYNKFDDLGVYISFKTDKAYFPLKPTSVYGERHVPAVIYLIGHQTPEFYPGLQGITEYMYSPMVNVKDELRPFFVGQKPGTYGVSDVKYTKVTVDVESKYYTQDLWFNDDVPEYVDNAMFVVYNVSDNHSFFVILLLSLLCSFLAGLIVYRNTRYWWFGIFNFFSLHGMMIIAYVLGEKGKKPVWKCLLTTALMVMFIPLIWFFLELGPYNRIFELLLIASMVWIGLTLFFAPFVYGYYNNRKVLKFSLLFTFLFVALSLGLQYLLSF